MRVRVEIGRKPSKPVLLWDGACRFCAFWAGRWRSRFGTRAAVVPWQKARGRFPELPDKAMKSAVHLIEPDGTVWRGASAVLRVRALTSPWGWGPGWWLYTRVPPFAALAEGVYAFVARHRGFFSFLTRVSLGRDPAPSTYALSAWIFPKALGLVAAVAVVSLWAQVQGLIGERGILPVKEMLDASAGAPGEGGFWRSPMLFWWTGGGEAALNWACAGALGCALLMVAGIGPGPAALGFWFFYLSLTVAGREFLSFQWDALLLETSLIAAFYGRWGLALVPGGQPEPPRAARWLLWLLFFKLMFLSGMVKLQSYGPGDANAWRDFTALRYHFWTQPLPAWSSWYLQRLPDAVQALSLWGMWVVELALPFLALGPRRPRRAALVGTWVFMGLILVSGNYGFFNLLTMVLALSLLDDQGLPRSLHRLARVTGDPPRRWRVGRIAMATALVPFAAVSVAVNLFHLVRGMEDSRRAGGADAWLQRPESGWCRALVDVSGRFRSINPYGLFRVMTTRRPEIAISGSADGVEWTRAEFRFKPGDPGRAPAFCVPHMPRVDWLMWFAALELEAADKAGSAQFRNSPRLDWLRRLLVACARREPAVLGLLARGPFGEGREHRFKIELEHYTFTTFGARDSTGLWWERVPVEGSTVQGRLTLP